MPVRAGSLDRYIHLQSKGAPSGFDPTSGTWTTQVSVYAERLDSKGVERYVGKQFAAEAQQAYLIRYRTDVNPTWRVLDGTSIWKILATPEGEGRRSEMLLMVRRFNPGDVTT